MKKKLRMGFLMVCAVLCMALGMASTASAAKFYSCRQLGVTKNTKGNYNIKSLKGNVLTYYKTKNVYDKKNGFYVNKRTGSYKKAKLTSKTKYYAADTKQFYKAFNNRKQGTVYDYYKLKHLRKLTKKQFFGDVNVLRGQGINKNSYKDSESAFKITVKNGKITQIVQYGHVAG